MISGYKQSEKGVNSSTMLLMVIGGFLLVCAGSVVAIWPLSEGDTGPVPEQIEVISAASNRCEPLIADRLGEYRRSESEGKLPVWEIEDTAGAYYCGYSFEKQQYCASLVSATSCAEQIYPPSSNGRGGYVPFPVIIPLIVG